MKVFLPFHIFSVGNFYIIKMGEAHQAGSRQKRCHNVLEDTKMQKCWICGKDAVEHRNIGERNAALLNDFVPFSEETQRCYCQECFAKVTEESKRDTAEYIRLKKKLMFERAVRILERQGLDIYHYKEAIQAVGEFAEEKPDKFDSSHEMIAAIMLIDNEISCELQHKVGRYQCDFFIPSMKVVLEIDGEHHKSRKTYDTHRDAEIMRILGRDWNIIRIKTEYLEQKAEALVDAIESVLLKRKNNYL